MDIGDLRYSDDGSILLECLDKGKSHYEILDGTEVICDGAFANCKNLISITIPPFVQGIGNAAFLDCVGLKKVVIEGCSTIIGEEAFRGCTGLISLAPDGAEVLLEEIFSRKFGRIVVSASITVPICTSRIYSYAFCGTGFTVVLIGRNVTEIEEGGFQGCKELKWVEIGSDVNVIERMAFAECEGLRDIRMHSLEPPKCNADAFSCLDKTTCTLHIPSGTFDAYSKADVWKDFKIRERRYPSYKV